MLKKLLVMLVASTFAFTAFAQAPKSDTTAPSGTEAKKDSKKSKSKSSKSSKSSKGKSKAKSDTAKKDEMKK